MKTLLWDGTTSAAIRNPLNTTVTQGMMRGVWNTAKHTGPVLAFKDVPLGKMLQFRARGEQIFTPIQLQLRHWDDPGGWIVYTLTGAEIPGLDWRTYQIPLSKFTVPPTRHMPVKVDHLVFLRPDKAKDGIIWVDDVYFIDAQEIDPEPEPNAERRVFRITDDVTAVASTTLVAPQNELTYSPISLGQTSAGLFTKGEVFVTDMPVGGRGGRSYAIKVAQGFKPDGPKRAYIAFECNGWTLDLGETIAGTIEPGGYPLLFKAQTDGPNPWTGEPVYSVDFTEFQTVGEYRIIVPTVGASAEFDINENVYDVICGHTARAFAYQHMGTKLTFPRVKSKIKGIMQGDILPLGFMNVLKGYVVFDACYHTVLNPTPMLLDSEDSRLMTDAADSDTEWRHARNVLGPLYVFLQDPAKFSEGQWGIPSILDYPDIVEIALKELRVWGILQDKFEYGGIPSVITTNEQHKDTPTNIEDTYVCSPPDALGSFAWGACFAVMGQAMTQCGYSNSWTQCARRAYEWGKANPFKPRDIQCVSMGKPGTGSPPKGTKYTFTFTQAMADALNKECELWKNYLALLLRENVPAAAFPSFLKAPACKGPELYIYYELAKRAIEPHCGEFWTRSARFVQWQNDSSNQYRQSLKPGQTQFGFGGFQGCLPAAELMLSYDIFGDDEFRDAAIENINNLRGVNAFGKSWISYDRDAWVRYQDSTPHVPGITIYGVSSPSYGVKWPARELGMRENPPRDKSFVPHQSMATVDDEFDTQLLAATFEALAMLCTSANVAAECDALKPYTEVEEASMAFHLP